MAIDATAKIVPGHGTLFVADVNTPVPANPLTAFTLTGTPPTGWVNLGHTSKDNTAAFTRDGGDKTVLPSWLADGVFTIYAATNWGLTINSIQIDELSLDLAFGGSFDTDGGYIIPASNDGVEKALFLLATDGTGALGFYQPNTSVALGDAPSIKTDGFFELPLAASIMAADAAVIPPAANGKPGLMKVYKTGLQASVPFIASALPSGAAAGSQVTITGSGFTGVTGAASVKFGATNASSYVVVNDTSIVAVMPAGSAGAANIVVTSPAGPSAAFAYTRGA